MKATFYPRLVNGPFEDPALFIPFSFEKRALLFDMGDLRSLPHKELLKITHAFVTHTHMDHFVGFDTLLRIFLGRNKLVHLFGPPDFLGNVEGKLAGYTWNLVKNYDNRFIIKATEVFPHRTLTRTYHCNEAFASNSTLQEELPFDGTLLKEPSFSIHAIHLDHKIPCLAFRLEERFHVNIMKDRLDELDVPVGPWLNRFKDALYNEQGRKKDIQVEWKEKGTTKRRTFCMDDLVKQIARISPGQKIVYIVDVVFDAENAKRIIDFASNADHFFVEAAFLHKDEDMAKKKYHLTAKQAGILAREANVKDFTLFHFSPKYADTAHLLHQEAAEAFSGKM